MLISEINPFVRYAKIVCPLPQNHFFKAVDSRIFFIIDAEKDSFVQIKSKNYQLKTNSLFYISANTPYKFTVNGFTKIISINFDFTQQRNQSHLPFKTKPVEPILNKTEQFYKELFEEFTPLNDHIFLENADFLLDFLNNILKEYISSNTYFRESCSALLKLSLLKIINAHEKNILFKNSAYIKTNEPIQKVKKYIHEHYKEDLTNDLIARQVDYHSYHLNRIFVKFEGVSLHKYLNNYRIIMAEKMLLETNESITFIATEVGFDNTTSFTQNFKAKNNLTPSKYRHIHRDDF